MQFQVPDLRSQLSVLPHLLNVSVTLNGQQWHPVPTQYQVYASVGVRSIHPRMGPAARSQPVTVSGYNMVNKRQQVTQVTTRAGQGTTHLAQPAQFANAGNVYSMVPAIAKQDAIRKFGHLRWDARLWNWVLGFSVDHGYRPAKGFLFSILICLLGGAVFWLAGIQGVMSPTSTPQPDVPYPTFQPLIYSVDVFLPIIDLQEARFWLPNSALAGGLLFRGYMWVHIILGWLFSSLIVASVTGLIRKD